jgi:hypothetical protein
VASLLELLAATKTEVLESQARMTTFATELEAMRTAAHELAGEGTRLSRAMADTSAVRDQLQARRNGGGELFACPVMLTVRYLRS